MSIWETFGGCVLPANNPRILIFYEGAIILKSRGVYDYPKYRTPNFPFEPR